MKPITLILSVLLAAASYDLSAGDGFSTVFWNLENFFDYTDGGYSDSDREFSPEGERHWSKSRYWKKCHGIAKTVLWMADRYGRLPDVMGVAEVENRGVMQSVISGTLLRKYDYVQIHGESPDRRGIDVALIYRKSSFSEICRNFISVTHDTHGNEMKTRDILHVCLEKENGPGERYHFLVNHHPSKYGGEEASRKKRKAVMMKVAAVCDSLLSAGEKNIICMGDFNDTPDGDAFSIVGGILVNKAMNLYSKGKGTIRYGGKWELIDMFLVAHGLDGMTEMGICFPGFLAVKDNAHSGMKPLRTYTGPKYTGGLSDHLPIILILTNT